MGPEIWSNPKIGVMRTHQANMRVGSEQKEWRIATSGEQRGCRTGSERRRPIVFKYAQPLTISSAIRFLLHPKPESASDSSCSQGLFSLRAKAISAKCVVTKTNDPQVIKELSVLLCIKRLFFRPVFFTEAGSVASAESTRQGFSAIKQRSLESFISSQRRRESATHSTSMPPSKRQSILFCRRTVICRACCNAS